MTTPRAPLLALAALATSTAVTAALLPARAVAQVEVRAAIRLPLPQLPTLVVIQPGVQVVQDFDDEVFLQGGFYWARRGDRWYRARGPLAEFLMVETRIVPEPLRRIPPGHYRRYHPSGKDKEAKKEEKRRNKEEAKERKAWEKGRKKDDHGGKPH